MQLGASIAVGDLGAGPAAMRDYAQTAEGLGFDYLVAPDHVLGIDPAKIAAGQRGSNATAYHDPFVLFGFLAAATTRVELVTGIVILPQRQTVLVAKQAAAVDVLSGGRLRLGVAVGWNPVEFEALGEDFTNRGRRIEEQIDVLRTLWTTELVTLKGRWHQVPDAGLNPLPVQRPIPIWMGGESERAVRRAARLADGWMPHFRPGPEAQAVVDRVHGWVREGGRDPVRFGVEARFSLAQVPRDRWAAELAAWRAMRGVTHLSVSTMGLGLETPADHVEMLRRFAEDASVRRG